MTEDEDPLALTVGQAATRLGVTVRTLHHWDDIGLARPSARTRAGYRLYSGEDLERLRRITVYRELELDLESIRRILDEPGSGTAAELQDQRARLAHRLRRLRAVDESMVRLIAAHDRGLVMTAEEQTAAFGPEWDPDWPVQARERYGETIEWQRYAERSAARSPEDWRAIAERSTALEHDLAEAMADGVEPGDAAADGLVEQHREQLSAYFPFTREMQVCLGRRYDMEPAFTEHFDRVRPGLARWLRAAIDASARAHGIDPERATWGERRSPV